MDPPMSKGWMVVAVVMVVRTADAGEPSHPLPIDLQMRNDAGVPAHVLEQSQDDVTRIFADAGLAVRWTDAAPRFTVHIVPQVLGYARSLSPVMGVALRSANGSQAHVFFRQVQDFARTYRVDAEHDAGLRDRTRNRSSSPAGGRAFSTGVMQAGWDKALVRDAARGSLTFTEAQAARIRASR